MNILMVGNGKGSWEMRGIQLGTALGARVITVPSEDDLRWADLVVLVKKHALPFAAMVQRSGKPIVWDALDFWAQPSHNAASPAQALALFKAQVAAVKPALVIAATQAMADSIGGVYLPHHSWYGLTPQAPSQEVRTVAYQGGAVYLGRWKALIEAACAKRGWRFVINPEDLRYADLLLAFRDGPYDGWICREWKSGVKLVNAIAAGRPIITQPSAAFRELCPDGSLVERQDDLDAAFDWWTDLEPRHAVVERAKARAKDFTLVNVAQQYHAILETVAVAA